MKKKKLLLVASLLLATVGSLAALSSCKEDNKIKYTFVGADVGYVELAKGQEYTLPEPVLEGYEFLGWYETADFSGSPVTVVSAQANKTYYAKWEQLCKITLNLNGGTLADGNVLYAKAGTNVYEFMKTFVPTKTNMQFGAWTVGDTAEELSSSVKATKDGLTLSAKYKTAYTIELYLQNKEKSGYEKAEESVTAYEYAGKTVTAKHSLTGFKTVEKTETVDRKEISENASENVFKLYYDRESYRLTFNPNYPNGQAGTTRTETLLYGESIDAPVNYTTEGYCLMGWATTKSGSVVYKANYIDSVLYNKEGESKVDKIEPTRDTTLYAVWAKGIADMFGSDDFLYLFGEDADVIYLSRGDVFFEGEYSARDKEFIFWDANEKVLLEGKLNSNNTYTYYDSTRVASKTLYTWMPDEDKMGLNEKIKIHFDEYDGITYSVADETGKTSNSEGTYIIDDNGFYVATFTSGEMKDKTVTITVGNVTGTDGISHPAFRLRNEEEYKLGTISRLAIQSNRLVLDEANGLTLDGFGNATINGNTYTYTMDANVITLKNSNAETVETLKMITENGLKGYVSYHEQLAQTFTLASGATLQLDGMFKAKYVGDTTVNAYYTMQSSVFGGYVITMTDAAEHTFLVLETTVDEEGASPEYTVEKKAAGYAEYYYKSEGGVYYAPLLVVNESESEPAALYAYTNAKKYVKVSSGTFTRNQDTGLYLYEAKTYYQADGAIKEPFNLENIKAVVCALDAKMTSYQINFWYSYTLDDDTSTSLATTYTADNGATLTLVGGFAIINENTNVTSGTYSERAGYIQISTANGSRYVELSGDKFVIMNHAPFTAYVLNSDGTISATEYVEFDGKGGAVYKKEDGKGNVVETHTGTMENNSQTTEFGGAKYTFVSTEKTFDFIQLNAGTRSVVAIENKALQGEFVSSVGTLKLDGFTFQASLVNKQGETVEGRYWLDETGLLVFSANGENTYFEKDGNEFTALGAEYGDYKFVQNQHESNLWIYLDGKGGLTVYEKADNGDKTPVAENQTYTLDGDKITLSYKYNDKTVTGILSGENFLCENESVVRTLVNEKDWSILVLDDYGNATKYNKQGKKFKGTYTLITDDLLYFASSASEEENLYVYDMAKGTIELVDLSEKIYCTEELETLHFKSSGFAVFNGTEECYYNIVNSKVIIYRRGQNGGFTAEEFGSFNPSETWEGKTYYLTSGTNVKFKRETANASQYTVAGVGKLTELAFTPQGNGSFEVDGYITLEGNSRQQLCKVVRKVTDDGVEMYVVYKGYHYGIEVEYLGDSDGDVVKNTYKITSLKWVLDAPSYAYLDNLYMLYAWYGSAAAGYQNSIGQIKLTREYNADGSEKTNGFYLSGTFGEGSKMYDTNGKIITFDEAKLSLDEKRNMYTATFDKDGYTYSIHFQIAAHPAFRVNAYRLYAFTRQEEITEVNDGYKVYASRVVATESTAYKVGSVYSVALYQGEEQLDGDNLYLVENNTVYFITRTKEGSLNKTATYYTISLVEEGLGEAGDNSKVLPTYQSASVKTTEVKTIYNEDQTAFVDVDEQTNTIKLVYVNERGYVVSDCQNDNGTYTLKTTAGKVFTVSFVEDKAVITEV